ncbi:hypothetical protein BDW59DRAFT_157661 [Aspergillus cavernicola]|uniref:Uncharacterized protein n=1 Tax=Aspergillus cavernicola TaxID=176166 RepID=A0ABR4IVA6_9EURO
MVRRQERTAVITTVSNPTGQGENATLNAIIDETIVENAISQKRLDQLRDALQVIPSDLGREKSLKDSRGVSYTARSRVRLLAMPRDGHRSDPFDFYIVESQDMHITGRYDILLAKGWTDKFPANDPRTYSAAPTELLKGNSRQERKEWERKGAEKHKENLARAADAQAVLEKRFKEHKAKEQQASSRN